jgi:hypothetical protein
MMDADAVYLSKIAQFERLLEERVDTSVSLLAGSPEAVREIRTAHAVITAAIAELTGLYDDLYIRRSPALGKDAALGFTRLEANIAMATQQTLDSMRRLIGLQTAGRPLKGLRSRVLCNRIRKVNAGLARRDPAAPLSLAVAVPEMLLARRKPVKTALTLAGLVVLHRSLTDWYRGLDPANFFRSDAVDFEGIEAANAEMAKDPRRVMLVIGNHDAALFEGAISYGAALQLGSQQHISMARRGVYPIPPPESAGDVVYVDEDDPKLNPVAQSLALVKRYSVDCDVVSFVIYPEGMLAFTGAQMPLVAKDGAYVIARKLAIELHAEGIPVYLVELKTNVLEHLTDPAVPVMKARVTGVEIVPSEPFVKGETDRWIAQRRRKSQTLYNENRGEKMIDITGSVRIPNSKTFQAEGITPASRAR